MRGRKDDLVGQKFGKWTVIERSGSRNRGQVWKCICDCGNIGYIAGLDLKYGKCTSCGCGRSDSHIIHGDSVSSGQYCKLYSSWEHMLQRCYNPHNKYYKNYGGAGVTVCDEWRHNYIAFREWALNNGYIEGLTIDRIDPFGNYEPSNCRWADTKTQGRNKREVKTYEYNGESHTLIEWSEITGICYTTLSSRIHASKWPIEDVLTKPVDEMISNGMKRSKLAKAGDSGETD